LLGLHRVEGLCVAYAVPKEHSVMVPPDNRLRAHASPLVDIGRRKIIGRPITRLRLDAGVTRPPAVRPSGDRGCREG
jgi:hypothetical protein